MKSWRQSFRIKILLSISLCIVVFCLLSGLVITYVLGGQLLRKNEQIARNYASVVSSYMEDMEENASLLAVLIRSDDEVAKALSYKDFSTPRAVHAALSAQERISTYQTASPVNGFIRQLFIFNLDGILVSGKSTMGSGNVSIGTLTDTPFFKAESGEGVPVYDVVSSVDGGAPVLACLYALDRENRSFVYMELDTAMFEEILAPYGESAGIAILSTGSRKTAWYSSDALKDGVEGRNEAFRASEYTVSETVFEPFHTVVQSYTAKPFYSADNLFVTYTLLATLITVIAAGFMVSRLVTNRVTKPLARLSGHIGKLADAEELQTEPEIEEGNDELSAIGKVVNRLVQHINELILRQKEVYEQKQKLEMKALQAQINPHFLYNTLDSIRWMAVIQKSESIAKTIGALENLLRNMAKGVGDEISLSEELSLTADYVRLQQVRYMEIFDYVCEVDEALLDAKIIKMTLQPIIENAILHGIEPTGSYGEISLRAKREGDDLYLIVEDNGAGMEEAELSAVLSEEKKQKKGTLSGIGVSNVDARIKMAYGEQYGLFFESKKNVFTRVTVHLPYKRAEHTAG